MKVISEYNTQVYISFQQIKHLSNQIAVLLDLNYTDLMVYPFWIIS